jgi:hypothetical protein
LRESPRNAAVATFRVETPALLPGDSGLGFSPWHTTELDDSDVHPKLGRRLCVSGRSLWVDVLTPETPVLRGWRLRSVWLGSGRSQGLDGPDSFPELG